MQTELLVQAVHESGMRVRASAGEFDVVMDYPLGSSEAPSGPTPLTMLLASLAACSVNSLVAVLKKMQQHVTGLGVEARALRSTEHPTVLTNIFLEFTVTGDAVDPGAVARAVHLAEERLCPVWNMLKASTEICAHFHVEQSESPQMPAV